MKMARIDLFIISITGLYIEWTKITKVIKLIVVAAS